MWPVVKTVPIPRVLGWPIGKAFMMLTGKYHISTVLHIKQWVKIYLLPQMVTSTQTIVQYFYRKKWPFLY